jgi:extradiol dioxygenase family protein
VLDASAVMFHHSIPVSDLEISCEFYGGKLGCLQGRTLPHRIDFGFFGHHLVLHLVGGENVDLQRSASAGPNMLIRHFGVFLPWDDWTSLAARLVGLHMDFLIAPEVRGEGTPLEEALMFLEDPSGNGIEFKTARDLGAWLTLPHAET